MARVAVLTLAVLLVAALSPAPDTAGLSQGPRQERTRQPAGPDGGHNLAASTPSTLARRSAGHQVLPPTGPAPSSPLPAASRPSHGQPGVTRGDRQAAQSASIQDLQSSSIQDLQSSTPQDLQSSSIQDLQSSSIQEHQSSTPQDLQSSSIQEHQSSTPQDQGQSVTHVTDNSTWDCELNVSLSSGSDQECVMANSTPSPRVLGSSGRIEWSGNGSRAECLWTISARPRAGQTLGLVLRFEDMGLQRGLTEEDSDKVTVYQGLEPLVNKSQAIVNGSLPVPPILLRSSHAAVRLEARSGQHGSSFALGYAVYLLDKLPPPAASAGPLSRYNCSSPYVVPEALRCDMVEQCLDGQDERDFNCSYPLWDLYIKSEQFDVQFFFPDDKISPFEARTRCEDIYPGRYYPERYYFGRYYLGELYNLKLKQLAAQVTSVSGHTNLVVNLVRFSEGGLRNDVMYRFLWKWPLFNQLELQGPYQNFWQVYDKCAILSTQPTVHFKSVLCSAKMQAGYVCNQLNWRPNSVTPKKESVVYTLPVSESVAEFNLSTCADRSVTQKFHPCYSTQNTATDHWNPLFRSFLCKNEKTVRYTLVLDGKDDCGDNSDEPEDGYSYPVYIENIFLCEEKHIPVPADKRCNGQPDCFDNSDEKDCFRCQSNLTLSDMLGCLPDYYSRNGFGWNLSSGYVGQQTCKQDPNKLSVERQYSGGSLGPDILVNDTRLKVLHLDGYGLAIVNISSAFQCPSGHLHCSDNLCIPGYLTHNSVHFCQFPAQYIEQNCSGSYRCLGGSVCLDPVYLCDSIVHCPYKDDELYCDMSCPQHCQCEGLEYKCQRMFDPVQHPVVRYLDLSGVDQPDLRLIGSLTFVNFLNLSSCGLTSLEFWPMNLIVFDLSQNDIPYLHYIWFYGYPFLQHLNLSDNPVLSGFADNFRGFPPTDNLASLDLSNTSLTKLEAWAFSTCKGLKYLDLSKNAIEEFAGNSLKGLDSLQMLVADDRELCCLYEQQMSRHITCHAPEDELSSCSDLLWSSALRVALWLQAGMAVAGNVAVMVSRLFFASLSQAPPFRVLVVNLSVADLLMGLYLVLIGSADARLMGSYLWQRRSWTDSLQCRAAGFMSLLSSQVSVLLICFITLDRLLVLGFPFRRQLHLTRRSASVVCGVAWVWGLLLAAIPLLPATQHWRFYSQTGICLPLPITRHQFPGQHYSFAVFIVLNFVLFVLIGAGQVAIYRCIRSSAVSSARSRRQQDAAIARRLFLVAFSDWCCWFPVGVLGMLAAGGLPIPGQLNVWVAVLVLPLNSALNPFLYTISGLLDTCRQRWEEERVQRVLNKLHVDIETWPEERAMECYQILVRRLGRATCSEDCMEPAQGATVSSEV